MGQNEEDVCFPMIKSDERTGIDFVELDSFVEESTRVAYTRGDDDFAHHRKSVGGRFQANHRPLAPQAIGIQTDRQSTSNINSSNSPDSQPSSDMTKVGVDLNEKLHINSSLNLGAREKNLLVPAKSRVQEYPEEPANPYQNATFTDSSKGSSSPDIDRFSFFAADSEETVHATNLPSLLDDGQSFKDLFTDENGTWWLDCLDPTEGEMRVLSKAFGIHPLTVEDIRTEESREKVELFRDYYFVCFHTFDSDPESEDFLEPINMYIVVFRDGILSFHFSPLQHSINVRRRIRQLRDYVSVSADWICYALIDDITDSFAPIIHEIEVETDIIEDSVFVARESDFGHMLRRIGEARRKVMTLLRLLSGKADVIKMFAKRCNEQWDNAPKGEIGLYLGDIQDHIITMYQNLSAYEKIFSRSHANYLAQIQVESVYSNNRVTQILGKATIIGTVLVPMNLITGLFGMNVKIPGEAGPNLGWFFGIVGFILLMVLVLGLLAQRWMDTSVQAVDQQSGGSRRAGSIFSRRSRSLTTGRGV
ncbi:putative Mg(2+) transporter ALR2 [Sugiyamaella lignohabitans]|uniref:Putative Mg(2+) transporter ALR2 n=1 Tax=Sugiyamaella lignohabitans TaxID=796027 RepID=A0A167FKN2_9ASCO|nr:putative Mg(2+) transporter ALR2 [Sugiyamaella lignohabitans]ANB15421.1 putative Mg(2+) transporter ALR2 [Sugiyamaella lignohabitans]